jgi:hypothetical protein
VTGCNIYTRIIIITQFETRNSNDGEFYSQIKHNPFTFLFMKGTVISQSPGATVWKDGIGRLARGKYYYFLHAFQSCSGANPASYALGRVPGDLSKGVRWQVHEVDHSPPSRCLYSRQVLMWRCLIFLSELVTNNAGSGLDERDYLLLTHTTSNYR